jgi:hypothetical protein
MDYLYSKEEKINNFFAKIYKIIKFKTGNIRAIIYM